DVSLHHAAAVTSGSGRGCGLPAKCVAMVEGGLSARRARCRNTVGALRAARRIANWIAQHPRQCRSRRWQKQTTLAETEMPVTSPEQPDNRMLGGTCQCGAVRYAVADEFVYAANCHCANCRRATGSAF